MGTVGSWPVAIVPFGGAACATLMWELDGQLHVTAVVKVRLRIRHGQAMAQLVPEPIDPSAGELAPFVPGVDVVLTAAAVHASEPVEAAAVRVLVTGDAPRIDKWVLVHATRPGGEIQPFTSAELVPDPSLLLVNPRDPTRRATLGPLAPEHPERLAALAGHPPVDVRVGIPRLPQDFPWTYFHVAPADQRCAVLRGDEWIVLQGLDRYQPLIASRLPAPRAEVRVFPPGLQRGRSLDVAMRLDRLGIDARQMTCTMCWRGSFAVSEEQAARQLVLVGGAALHGDAGAPTPWPSRDEIERVLGRCRERGDGQVSAFATTADGRREPQADPAAGGGTLAERAQATAARLGDRAVSETTERIAEKAATLVIDHRSVVHIERHEGPRVTETGTLELATDELPPLAPPLEGCWLHALALGATPRGPSALPPSHEAPPRVPITTVQRMLAQLPPADRMALGAHLVDIAEDGRPD